MGRNILGGFLVCQINCAVKFVPPYEASHHTHVEQHSEFMKPIQMKYLRGLILKYTQHLPTSIRLG